MNTETQNYETERKILDSGNRRVFSTGAVRDIAEGKGRCDLLPLHIVANLYSIWDDTKMKNPKYATTADILRHLETFIRNGNREEIYDALFEFRTRFFLVGAEHLNMAGMLLEVSKHYEEGAKKYAERNWEAGIPCHCYIDSAIRHLIKWADNWDDEPHDRAVVWNLFGLLWTIDNHPELNDLPYVKTIEPGMKGDIEGFSVDFDPGMCLACKYFAGTNKKCDYGKLISSKVIACSKYEMESEVTENG